MRARTKDPYTSHVAGQSIESSLTQQHGQILEFLKARPEEAFAPEQISDVIGFQCWRRMSELENKDLIVETDELHRNRSNRQARKFRLVATRKPKEMPEIEEEAHSNLGPSAAPRWTRCPGSVMATHDAPNYTNIYAAEGTVAHKVADNCLRKGKDASAYKGQMVKEDEWEFEVNAEMVRGVQLYVNFVRDWAEEHNAEAIRAEVRVYLTRIHPDIWGAVISGDGTKLLIVDLKYGRVGVPVEENEQLLCYAVGSLLGLEPAERKKIKEIELVIVQPRVGQPIKRWTVTRQYLNDWAKWLKVAAEATDDPVAPRIPGAKQCEWCAFRPKCPEVQADVFRAAQAEFDDDDDMVLPQAGELSLIDMSSVLAQAGYIRSYLSAIEHRALKMLEDGEPVPGYKLVERTGRRAWDDRTAAEDYIKNVDGANWDDYMTAAELKSPAKIDEILTKEQREEIAEFWVSKSSGTKMVPETDPAEEVTSGADSDFADE